MIDPVTLSWYTMSTSKTKTNETDSPLLIMVEHMDRDQTIQKIKEIIAETSKLGINADEVGDEPNVVTRLGLQSTQILEITVELENEFGIEFEDTEITEELWTSVGSLADGITAKKG
ncbi:MAG TPA: hypothetical protein DCE42_12665 [Myxococcales bacterium]|mgnify:CR=1 FL=1|nr:hypothetical protein [Deltaproteobacteria bacterium]MBU50246.1 hypothetical protein [Deltaproteobacteria bacterium]HAA55606.1 hypothetical protein [Myxococcales bacterium]|tara:strand:- start:2307 stop:2657 length:351 start_codon:yes stop_codon:yes gene_type:complete